MRNPLRVLLVGAGFRIQNNFLPALRCMTDTLEVIGIYSRTLERLLPVADKWGLKVIRDLDDVDFGAVDVVAVSIPTSQNAAVLQRLVPHASHLSVVIDTPIAWKRSELVATFEIMQKFKRVLVAEDFMNFPPFDLMRQAVQGGMIGKLQALSLYNTGYKYHGTALIRSFVGFKKVRSTRSRGVGRFSKIVNYSFGDGYNATVVGPYYSRYIAGGIAVEGSKGVITDFPEDSFGNVGNRSLYRLRSKRSDDGSLSGYYIDAADGAYSVSLPDISKMMTMEFKDKSDLNLLKNCGLTKIFQALYEGDNLNNAYGPVNALYDSFMARMAEDGILKFDPFVWFASDAVTVMRAVSGIYK